MRVVSWNVQGLGRPGSPEYDAQLAVLRRLDADIVGLQEVDEGQDGILLQLAADAGYDTTFVPASNPFGPLRNAVMTRLDLVEVSAPSAGALSGERSANDLTRLPVRLQVYLPGMDQRVTVVVQHWKSGFDLDDEFRRAVDGIRTAQAADVQGPTIAMGDVNAELEDMPEDPPVWLYPPDGLPESYRVGTDVQDRLSAGGIPNDAFAPLLDLGLEPQQLRQIDGRPDTRPSSGRVIDWILVSEELADATVGEVYDSTDEGQGEGLPKAGDAPPRPTSADASDHLPVFVDVTVAR